MPTHRPSPRGPAPPAFLAGALAAALALGVAAAGCLLEGTRDRHGLEAMESGRTMVGAWLGSWPTDGNPAIRDFERSTGAQLDLVDIYLDWRTPFENVSHTLDHIAAYGALPILTWEAQGIPTTDILAGTRHLTLRDGRTLPLQDYLEEFAEGTCRAAQRADQPVLLRVLHEMNGGWFAWGISWQDAGGERPNSEERFRAAWIRIHDAFSSRCGDDVLFIWAVNHFSVGSGTSFTGAYPGDDYVDFVAIDGYNWGANADWGWQDFNTLFRPAYCALTASIAKPLLVAEVSSTERGGDKSAWIADMYTRLAQYDRIRGFVWFNHDKFEVEIHGTMDWPVSSSPAALAAFSEGASALEEGRDAEPGLPDPCGRAPQGSAPDGDGGGADGRDPPPAAPCGKTFSRCAPTDWGMTAGFPMAAAPGARGALQARDAA